MDPEEDRNEEGGKFTVVSGRGGYPSVHLSHLSRALKCTRVGILRAFIHRNTLPGSIG